MQQARNRLLTALEEIDTVAFFFVDLEGVVRYVNSGVERLLGYAPEKIMGKPVEVLLPMDVRDHHSMLFRNYASRRSQGEVGASRIVRKTRYFPELPQVGQDNLLNYSVTDEQGNQIPISLTVNEVCNEDNELEGFVGFILDCSTEYHLQKKIRRNELYDEPTGLLCWKGLRQQVQELEARYRSDAGQFDYSLIQVDIDHYSALAFDCKAVADLSTRLVANWLRSQVLSHPKGRNAIVSKHLNATEFLIYLPNSSRDQACQLADELREKFPNLNLGTDVQPFHTTLSMGVVTVTDGMKLDYAMSRAADACYRARSRGHDKVVCAGQRDLKIYELGQVIRDALRVRRIDVHAQKIVPLQPIYGDASGESLYVEVLCRLRDRRGSVISPELVFSAAEQLGLAQPLDMYMIGEALSRLSQCSHLFGRLERCSLNLSGVSVSSEQTYERISSMIDIFAIPAEKLCFEITESAAIRDNNIARANLNRLRDMGCKVAIDDFGSGYSNFHSLSGWPIDVIKIDGSYIRAIAEDAVSLVDVRGMIASARVRGIEVVAEYVDNDRVLNCLKELGVDYAQGYHFHRPEPLRDLLV